MPRGRGRYDAECVEIRERVNALGTVLIVVAGDRGHGVSLQCEEDFVHQIPEILEDIARDIREGLKKEAH
jgi:translation initiation factor 6 (eIF-6)